MGRFSEKLAVLGAQARGDSITTVAQDRAGLIFQRTLAGLLDRQSSEEPSPRPALRVSVERAIFLTVLHRLFAPGSDRGAEKWKDGLRHRRRRRSGLTTNSTGPWPGWERFFRKTSRTGPRLSLPAPTRISSRRRCSRGAATCSPIWTSCFRYYVDLLRGEGGETLGQHGHSKDHRPDLKQMVVAWCWTTTAIRSAPNCGRATRPT